MVDFIVDILNAISSGISQSQVDDLLKTPAAYNSSMYNLSLSIAQTAVKPVASMVLATGSRSSSRGSAARSTGTASWA